MEDDKFKDLLEDEELTALRLAALASKRKNEKTVDNSSETADALPINSIVTAPETVSNQIPFLQSDRNAFNNHHSWRKLHQTTRRRGGTFLKNNHRSNLIVISPVAPNEGKDSEEKAPALLLPQHKWSHSGNDDSMSPKTLRKTGPTRFNRHGSDSESSDDSDYEHSDNDSGSNETVLQDEPSEKFSRLSPDSDSVSDVEKKRRLSFQRLDSDVKTDSFDKAETTSVYNLLKNSSYADTKQDSYAPVQNVSDSRLNWNHSVEGEYNNYKQYNSGCAFTKKLSDTPESFSVKQTNSSVTSNGESSTDKSNVVTHSPEKSNTWHHARNRTSDSFPENSRNLGSNDQKSKSYSDNRQSLSERGEKQSLNHSTWQHSDNLQTSSSFYPRETTYSNSKNYQENTSKSQLCESDLRLELKKRMQEVKSQSAINDTSDNTLKKYDQRNTSEKNRLSYAYETSKISDTFNKNSLVNKQESSKSNDQDSSTLNQQVQSRYNRSSSLGKSRNDRSASRDRNRHDRSSSWDRRRDRSLSPYNKSKSTHMYREDHGVKGKSSVERNFSADRKNDKFKSSQNRRLSERSSSRDRSKRDHSSSSDSRYSRSLSRERKRRGYYSKRNKRSRSISHDRRRRRFSVSRDGRSRSSSRSGKWYSRSNSRDRSRSCGSTSDRSRSREWSKCSSNQDESRLNRNTKNKSTSQSISSSKYSFSHKSKYSESFSQDQTQKDSTSDIEQGNKNSQHKKIEFTQNSVQMLTKEFESSSSKEQPKFIEGGRLQNTASSEKKGKIKRSPHTFNRENDFYKNNSSRSRSSSSESYSSSFSSSSSYGSKPKLRSVPSVIKPVVTKRLSSKNREIPNESKKSGKSICSTISKSDTYSASKSDGYKKNVDVSDINKLSTIKCRIDGDLKVSDNSKRVPVHMRLGAFPRKHVIQMPKDVEAAFVNTSSSSDSETVNTKCKRQNFRIVTNMYEMKSGVDSSADKPVKRSPDIYQDKSKRLKARR